MNYLAAELIDYEDND